MEIQELEAKIASLNRFIAEEFEELKELRELLRWRDAKKEPPKKNGCYLTAQNMSLDGGVDFVISECDYRQGRWLLDSFVEYWRPLGPLPGDDL
jgi:hypothetical protein